MSSDTFDFGIINEILQLKPEALMMVGISFFLRVLKMSKFVCHEDWIFGAVAIVIGGAVYPFIAEIGKSYNVRAPWLVLVFIGVALGGLTVTIHDTVWRFIAKRTGIPTGSTEITTKTKTEAVTGETIERTIKTVITPPDETNKSKTKDESENLPRGASD